MSEAEPVAALTFKGATGSFISANPPQETPATEFQDAAGEQHTLAEYRGKVVLVNFWATWCPACLQEMESLNRLQAKLGEENFVVLTISQDTPESAAAEFLAEHDLAHLGANIDKNRKLGLSLAQEFLPTSVLVNEDGMEVGRLIGSAEWDSPEAIALIRHFMRGSDASAKRTRE
ncbi:MAG: TlpA family protein disulfide reductase [Sphingomonadales bacterium]